jgi:hypothetical protein
MQDFIQGAPHVAAHIAAQIQSLTARHIGIDAPQFSLNAPTCQREETHQKANQSPKRLSAAVKSATTGNG